MSDVTVLLTAIERGDLPAAEQLLPLVCDELHSWPSKCGPHFICR
ncbi:MAG: hypothetical protein O2856_01690 [Planctomycetota bacterium]|nr:hypothetical protein [Planctomycetota bacterium]